MRKNNKQSGLVLWFTGLSQSGKSTTADKVYEILKQKGLKTERLDGDIVRQSLTKDLGFSKEDRDKNIERVTFVAKLLARNGVIVLASFISPYRQRRRKTRKEIEESAKFVEVFCRCPVEICEKRDTKGLYDSKLHRHFRPLRGTGKSRNHPRNP